MNHQTAQNQTGNRLGPFCHLLPDAIAHSCRAGWKHTLVGNMDLVFRIIASMSARPSPITSYVSIHPAAIFKARRQEPDSCHLSSCANR